MHRKLNADTTGFENWSSLETLFFWAYDGRVTPELQLAPHIASPFYALYLRSGSTRIQYSNHTESYGSGSWIFPKNETGTHIFSADAHILAVRFRVSWPNGTPLFDRSRTIVFEEESSSLLTRSATRLHKYISKYNLLTDIAKRPLLNANLNHYIMIQELFSGWISAYHRTFTNAGYQTTRFGALSDRVKKCIRYLRHRPFTSTFYEGELAGIIGISVSQLCKIFIVELGLTPNAYWNSRRLQAAQMELRDSDKTIKEIAFSLGFSSPEHFSRWFSKETEVTPRFFRKHQIPSKDVEP